jgi:DNA-binding NarL/FixJ family response regulator
MRVAVADDALLIREGLIRVLAGCGIDVVAGVASADELLNVVEEHRPDVAIVDIRMPPQFTSEGLRAADRLRVTHPELAVLVLSQYKEPA